MTCEILWQVFLDSISILKHGYPKIFSFPQRSRSFLSSCLTHLFKCHVDIGQHCNTATILPGLLIDAYAHATAAAVMSPRHLDDGHYRPRAATTASIRRPLPQVVTRTTSTTVLWPSLEGAPPPFSSSTQSVPPLDPCIPVTSTPYWLLLWAHTPSIFSAYGIHRWCQKKVKKKSKRRIQPWTTPWLIGWRCLIQFVGL
jgi:hypothetical protein